MFNKFLAAAFLMACVALASNSAQAQIGQGNYPNHLFAQYTTQGQGGLSAGKYLAPHPVPSHVGHSYRTYEPLMPHEMMYEHQRNYFNYYNDNSFRGGGPSLNITSVRWQNGSQGVRPLALSNNYIAKLQYGLAKRAYGLGDDGGGIGSGLGGCLDGSCLGGGQLRGKLKSKCAGGRCGRRALGDGFSDGGFGGEIISDGGGLGCSTCAGN